MLPAWYAATLKQILDHQHSLRFSDQSRWGAPEFVLATEGSHGNRKRRVFGIQERRRGSVVWHSATLREFLVCHFAVPMAMRCIEAMSKQLLCPAFGAVVVPVTSFWRLHCQVGSILQVPLKQIHKWMGPVVAWTMVQLKIQFKMTDLGDLKE